MSDLLGISDFSVHYHDGTEALRGIDLAVAAGERVGLIGPNGAGKTTLLLAVMGGVHWHGKIVVDGAELTPHSAQSVRSGCGMTFQEADDQLFMPTLLEDVAFGPLNQGLSADDARQVSQAAIAAVGLAGADGKSAHHLSGGQKRLASLATVLSMRVKLLLLDEPGANLDVRSRRRLTDVLAGRSEAMLLATHDLDMVSRLCGRTVLMEAGRVIADRPTADMLGDEQLLRTHGMM